VDLEVLGGAAHDHQPGLQLGDPAACRHQFTDVKLPPM
jgi:hypothetical protein